MVLNRVYLESVKGDNIHATSSLVTCQSVDLIISVGADFLPKYQLMRKLKDFQISFGTSITLSCGCDDCPTVVDEAENYGPTVSCPIKS